MKKIGVYIGRFQPLHNGHVQVIKDALETFDRVIILIGSANQRSSFKNPFNYKTRKHWIESTFNYNNKVQVFPLNDYIYNDTKWMSDVRETVNKVVTHGQKISLIGYDKDESSWYLKHFPEWDTYLTPYHGELDATTVRTKAYNKNFNLSYDVPEVVGNHIINTWMTTENYINCRDEYRFYQDEITRFADYPYPETLRFTCSDAVVTCAGYVLLIKRKFSPGKDCWALPGGFVNRGETRMQAAVRELYEETNLRVPEKVILGSVKNSNLFDNPNRSFGIQRETLAVHFDINLNENGKLPRANGCDDASEAKWIQLSELDSVSMYDDHRDIIEYFTGV